MFESLLNRILENPFDYVAWGVVALFALRWVGSRFFEWLSNEQLSKDALIKSSIADAERGDQVRLGMVDIIAMTTKTNEKQSETLAELANAIKELVELNKKQEKDLQYIKDTTTAHRREFDNIDFVSRFGELKKSVDNNTQTVNSNTLVIYKVAKHFNKRMNEREKNYQ